MNRRPAEARDSALFRSSNRGMRALLVAGLWAVVACEPGPPLSGTDAGTPVPGAACPPACAPMIEGVGQAKPATAPAPAVPGGGQPFCY